MGAKRQSAFLLGVPGGGTLLKYVPRFLRADLGKIYIIYGSAELNIEYEIGTALPGFKGNSHVETRKRVSDVCLRCNRHSTEPT